MYITFLKSLYDKSLKSDLNSCCILDLCVHQLTGLIAQVQQVLVCDSRCISWLSCHLIDLSLGFKLKITDFNQHLFVPGFCCPLYTLWLSNLTIAY